MGLGELSHAGRSITIVSSDNEIGKPPGPVVQHRRGHAPGREPDDRRV